MRELTQKRVWFAVPLLSATAPEVQRLIAQAKQWAEILGKRVILWVSDKQDAFVTGIAAEFPEVPHRYCDNHFLRDAAKPVLDADSHAKVQMRKKVRGLRGIERSVLKQRRQRIKEEAQALPQSSIVIETVNADNAPVAEEEPAGDVILEYCTVVRGILNDDQGGPLHPPGLRMAEALGGVIAPVPGIMRLFWAFSSSNPPESPSQEDSSLANILDTLEARCRSDGPPAGPRSIDPLPGSRSFLTVSAVA